MAIIDKRYPNEPLRGRGAGENPTLKAFQNALSGYNAKPSSSTLADVVRFGIAAGLTITEIMWRFLGKK